MVTAVLERSSFDRRSLVVKILICLLVVCVAFGVMSLVHPQKAHAESWCTWSVSAAAWGLGAFADALLAGVGEGVWIAGVFFSSELLSGLSTAMSGWATLEGFVAATVCS